MNRFETEILTSLKEPEVLDGRAGEVDGSRSQRCSLDNLILDLNSSASETYGRRERSA